MPIGQSKMEVLSAEVLEQVCEYLDHDSLLDFSLLNK